MFLDVAIDAIANTLVNGGSPFYRWYAAAWATTCLAAAAVACHDGRRLLPEARSYLGFLAVPWKLAVFAPALLFVTFAGTYAYDDTWDTVTGSGMSALTFLTAPWAVGAMYRVAMGMRPRRDAFLAAVVCLFSASWFYDGYLFWRDGYYTSMWLPNLLVSPYLYVAGGLLWNLEPAEGKWARLSFVRDDWPAAPADRGFKPVLLACAPFVAFAAVVLIGSVRWKVL